MHEQTIKDCLHSVADVQSEEWMKKSTTRILLLESMQVYFIVCAGHFNADNYGC
jgi:hypothetical protein